MKLSKFVLPLKLASDHFVLFSTLSKSVVKIDENTYHTIRNEDWEGICSTDFDCLKNMGFIVESLDDEKKSFVDNASSKSRDGKHFNLHLLATTGCNFRCSYCFQDGVEPKSFKLGETDSLLAPIEKYLSEHGIETLSLVLYGGEPTLNWHFTKEFTNSLALILNNNGIKYDTEIITNGYALSDDKLSFLAAHNCKKIQITLDGCRGMHDSRRILRDGKPTFEKIIANIHTALDNNYVDKVSIRLNYDKQNVHSQMKLLDYLASEFDVNRIHISLGYVTDSSKEPSSTTYINNNVPESNKYHVKAYASLYARAKQLGFKMKKYYAINGICIAKRNHSVLMCADGNYYKCGGLIGRDNHSVGKVGSALISQSYYYPEVYDKCFDKKCEMIPLCHAGCRLDAFHNDGHLHSLDCKYHLLKGINKELLKINYNVPYAVSD